MPIAKWVALLAITHRFRFTEAEYRARREVFERSISLDLVTRIFLAEKLCTNDLHHPSPRRSRSTSGAPFRKGDREFVGRDGCASRCGEGEIFARVVEDVCLREMAEASRARRREAVVAYQASIDFGVMVTLVARPFGLRERTDRSLYDFFSAYNMYCTCIGRTFRVVSAFLYYMCAQQLQVPSPSWARTG